MKIGSRYKIARRYGAELFEKTSTQKFALRSGQRMPSRSRSRSDFAVQLAEKQKARFLYGVSNAQLRALSRAALEHAKGAAHVVFSSLEMRLDNVAYRAGLSLSRAGARQIVSHGHVLVNGRRVTVPSYRLGEGDRIRVRSASISKKCWREEKAGEAVSLPAWLRAEVGEGGAREWSIVGVPHYVRTAAPFNVDTVLEFYRR
jgi:small subunit ribosomal protein S4